jgi:universal stress protein E
MSAIRRILVAIKDPESRQHSNVTKAAQLAQAFDAELVLFHAMAMPVAIEAVLRTQEGFRDFERGELERRLARLESKAERLRRQKIRVKVAATWDFPVHEAIVRHARRVKADLIVADIHAGPRLAPWVLHLTDWELLRTSPVPVLVVKTLRAWRRPTVLAAIDPRHAFAKPAGLDARILNAGAEFSRALRGTLHVMHAYVPVPGTAIPLIAGSSGALAELAADTEARARQAFQRALRAARIPRSRRHLVRGTPGTAIQRTARAVGAQIAVMGAISRSGLKRVMIGNTAETALGDLGCDVLVVKPARFVTRVARGRRGVRYVATSTMPFGF